jgi:hypothetical protein
VLSLVLSPHLVGQMEKRQKFNYENTPFRFPGIFILIDLRYYSPSTLSAAASAEASTRAIKKSRKFTLNSRFDKNHSNAKRRRQEGEKQKRKGMNGNG